MISTLQVEGWLAFEAASAGSTLLCRASAAADAASRRRGGGADKGGVGAPTHCAPTLIAKNHLSAEEVLMQL